MEEGKGKMEKSCVSATLPLVQLFSIFHFPYSMSLSLQPSVGAREDVSELVGLE